MEPKRRAKILWNSTEPWCQLENGTSSLYRFLNWCSSLLSFQHSLHTSQKKTDLVQETTIERLTRINKLALKSRWSHLVPHLLTVAYGFFLYQVKSGRSTEDDVGGSTPILSKKQVKATSSQGNFVWRELIIPPLEKKIWLARKEER